MNRKVGYYRVSTADQNAALQISALELAQCDQIYGDQGISGSERNRPDFDKALSAIERGDTLVIWRLDRMSRSLKHLIEINQVLNERGAFLESLTEKIDTSTPMGEFVFHILGAVAQLEREIIRERTLAGLSVAAANGKFPGRKRKLDPQQISWAARRYYVEQAKPSVIAADLDVHPETLRRHLKPLHTDIREYSAQLSGATL
ncbi:MAG: recombinase family protein [Pseudomonadota bacterium]